MVKWISIVSFTDKKYFSVIKRSEVLIHVSIWMNAENIYVDHKKPHAKGHILLFNVISTKFPNGQIQKQKTGKLVVATVWGKGVTVGYMIKKDPTIRWHCIFNTADILTIRVLYTKKVLSTWSRCYTVSSALSRLRQNPEFETNLDYTEKSFKKTCMHARTHVGTHEENLI